MNDWNQNSSACYRKEIEQSWYDSLHLANKLYNLRQCVYMRQNLSLITHNYQKGSLEY